MPEAPEIQAHAERMTEALAGKSLQKFELLQFASLKTFDPPPDGAIGSVVLAVARRAKYLLIQFDNGHCHVFHLMQGGRIRPDPKQARKPRFGLARWVFDDDAWLFTEAGNERKAGVWVLQGTLEEQPPLEELGPELVDLTVQQFGHLLSDQSRRIHGVLRDQHVIAGLGRMLANEICFAAGLSPFANAAKLSAGQINTLWHAMNEVVAASTDHERTLDGIGKSVDRPSKVHHRAGDPCLECEDTIQSVEYRRHTVYYCPTKQTSGKKLADNTTSKFLR